MLKLINNKEDCHLTATKTTTYAAAYKKIKRKAFKVKNTYNYNLTPRYGLLGNAGLHIHSGVFSTILLGGAI